MSWISALLSRALALADRNWDSLARRHGCCDTCTLSGSSAAMVFTFSLQGFRLVVMLMFGQGLAGAVIVVD